MSYPLRDQPDRLSYSGEDTVKCSIWYGYLAFCGSLLYILALETGARCGSSGNLVAKHEVGSWDWSQTEVVWFIVFSPTPTQISLVEDSWPELSSTEKEN